LDHYELLIFIPANLFHWPMKFYEEQRLAIVLLEICGEINETPCGMLPIIQQSGKAMVLYDLIKPKALEFIKERGWTKLSLRYYGRHGDAVSLYAVGE
jgi:hypothetical protein